MKVGGTRLYKVGQGNVWLLWYLRENERDRFQHFLIEQETRKIRVGLSYIETKKIK